MTDQQQLSLLPPHRNHGLFADHYLDHVLPGRPEWRALGAEAEGARARIREIFAGFVPSEDETQTEKDFIRPVLDTLGFDYEVNVRLRVPGTHPDRPDYVFYRDDAARQANKNVLLDKRLPEQGGLAVGDAKRWNRPLDHLLRDGRAGGNENPAYQIHKYVLYSGVAWGILTNGKRWRLVHRDTADRLDVYYEVDLEEAVRAQDPADFLYFYAFFRRAAFDPGPLGLAELLDASTSYARSVGASLKAQVYDALRHVAQGFLDYPANKLTPEPETLAAIHDHALILLYRLIFILYAEARELLPVRENAAYRETYSLQAIKGAVARDLNAGRRLLPTSARIWPQLKELFGFINRGEPPLRIGTFNGGLFDPEKHPFLEQYAVGDHHLQQAIDKLARVDGEFIDYRDLAVRHMGTIYEGLLEYHLQPQGLSRPPVAAPPSDSSHVPDQLRDCPRTIASAPDFTIDQPQGLSRPPVTAPPSDSSHVPDQLRDCPRTIASAFTIDLVNDKGERKATGSYYTPDYVVEFMVERAVGPALREAVAGKATDAEKVQAVLEVNVLDPATGSGHFLVEAVEYIARFLVDLGVAPEGRTAEEADLAFWKRRVVHSCIYGVDLNPLAVELAKLSLWLITVAKDRPLSFLDHHLRPGNSLVGARLAALQQHDNGEVVKRKTAVRRKRKIVGADSDMQTALDSQGGFRADMFRAVGAMWLIERSEAADLKQVKEQEKQYEIIRAHFTEKYGKLADLLIARNFGLEVAPDILPAVVDYVLKKPLATTKAITNIARQAAEIAKQERFFHWELEFPEVFFDQTGNSLGEDGGFEVVIGNPPYIRQEQLAAYKPIFEAEYPEVYHGMADVFVYFFAQGLRQTKRGGRQTYISSNSWLRANYATALRHYLRTKATVEMLVDIGDNHVFAEAPDVYPAVDIVRNLPPAENQTAQVAVFTRSEGVEPFETKVDEKLFPVGIYDQPDSGWQLTGGESRRLFAKLMAAGRPLGEVVNGKIYYGIKTGLNEAFIIDQQTRDRLIAADPGCEPLLKKMLRGEDLRPWYQEDEGRWLIALPCGWTRRTFGDQIDEIDPWDLLRRRYPNIAAHLLPYAEAAQARYDQGEYWWELRSCDYYDVFDQPKIFWPDIVKFPRFSWDESGAYVNDKGFILLPEDPYILGILQSRSTWYCIANLCVPLGERAGWPRYQQKSQFISRLPIPDAPPADREAIGGLALAITEQASERYALHERVRHRLTADLRTFNPLASGLNQKLTAWWALDFPTLRAEVKKVFKRDIPLNERDEWESWHAAQRAAHAHLTADIVHLETDLNARVYALFGLTAEEIGMIEELTKYRYGEV
ncbi:MAG: Eco57I restriction-modification methylase domain-containing protein [Armatimonadota bacterium]